MASGIIMGKCYICKELVWEDDKFTFDSEYNISHTECHNCTVFRIDKKLSSEQIQRIPDFIEEIIEYKYYT